MLNFATAYFLFILSTAKAEDWEEDERQQGQTNAETSTFAKCLGYSDSAYEAYDNTSKGDEARQYPPWGLFAHLKEDYNIVNWDYSSPTRVSGF